MPESGLPMWGSPSSSAIRDVSAARMLPPPSAEARTTGKPVAFVGRVGVAAPYVAASVYTAISSASPPEAADRLPRLAPQ